LTIQIDFYILKSMLARVAISSNVLNALFLYLET